MQNDKIMLYIAGRVKLLRGIRKLTLGKIASQMGLSRKQIQNYENGCSAIPIARLWQLANIMNVNIEFFWDGIKERTVENNNDDLLLVKMFHQIRDKNIKEDIINMIKALIDE